MVACDHRAGTINPMGYVRGLARGGCGHVNGTLQKFRPSKEWVVSNTTRRCLRIP